MLTRSGENLKKNSQAAIELRRLLYLQASRDRSISALRDTNIDQQAIFLSGSDWVTGRVKLRLSRCVFKRIRQHRDIARRDKDITGDNHICTDSYTKRFHITKGGRRH